ncbi:MAG TPA: hypothetical protein VEK08_24465 [Planctomycetota bacterium]|nr:hypothetical protein [Planctomycetota bacterium]
MLVVRASRTRVVLLNSTTGHLASLKRTRKSILYDLTSAEEEELKQSLGKMFSAEQAFQKSAEEFQAVLQRFNQASLPDAVQSEPPAAPLAELQRDLPWQNDEQCWEAGAALLIKVRELRGLNFFPDKNLPEEAEKEIINFCRKLRRSSSITLGRLQKQYRLTNVHIVFVLATVTGYFQTRQAQQSAPDIAALACGTSPQRLQRIRSDLSVQHGIGLLVSVDEDSRLWPTPLLIEEVTGGRRSDQSWKAMKAQIQELPSIDKEEK